MNPLTNMKNVLKLSEQELKTGNKTSWHDQYRDSAWLFIGGLPFDLTEGDIICIFSQYGEIVNINLIRDKDSGKSKGFCFLCYEDQRSTDLAVDNFNGIKILNRIIRVDHVQNYKVPKQGKKTDEETKKLYDEGCAPKAVPILPVHPGNIKKDPDDLRETLADQIKTDIQLPRRLPICPIKREPKSDEETTSKKEAKESKAKKSKKKKKKRKKKRDSSSHSGGSDHSKNSDTESDHKKKNKKKKSTATSDSQSNDDKFKNYYKKSEETDNRDFRNYENRKQRERDFDNKRERNNDYYDNKNRDKSNDQYRRSRSRSLDKNRRYNKPQYHKEKSYKDRKDIRW